MKGLKSLIPEKVRASICHNCPLCRFSRTNPDSLVGKLHHRYHAEECPMWEAEKTTYGEHSDVAAVRE